MIKKRFKYKISTGTLQRANDTLIKRGISATTRNAYTGDINVEFKTRNGQIIKSFTNEEIKEAFAKALNSYAKRI